MMNRSSTTDVASSLEFFKVFLPNSGSMHMSIPPAFVKHLNGSFPEKAIIKDPMGKSWRITLEKLDDLVYFKSGWQAFVDYQFLKYGDFLVFQYDGHCTFDVKIFGKNGCKKAVAAKAASSVPISKAKEEPVVEKEEAKHSISRKRKRLQVGSEIVCKPSSIAAPNRGRPSNASNSVEQVGPRGPSFVRTMKRWSNQAIYVSVRVVRDQNIRLNQNIVLRDEEGQLWPATICFTSQNRSSISAGWSNFYKGHKLRINDKCDFEFVLEKGNVCAQFNVKVTRHRLARR